MPVAEFLPRDGEGPFVRPSLTVDKCSGRTPSVLSLAVECAAMTRSIAAIAVLLISITQDKKPVTLDDLFRLTSIVDVKISPQGDRVAYVTSKPFMARKISSASWGVAV